MEIAATVLLSIAVVATAWSGYQAALWDGIQSSLYTQASAARTLASQNNLEANQNRIIDSALWRATSTPVLTTTCNWPSFTGQGCGTS